MRMTHKYLKIRPVSVFPEMDSIKLFGAILSAISELYPEKKKEFMEQMGRAEIQISSAFPIIDDILFFPKPVIRIEKDLIDEERDGRDGKDKAIDDSGLVKKFENLRFVSQSVFEYMIEKCVFNEELLEKLRTKEFMFDEHANYLYSNGEEDKLPKREGTELPGVSVERITQQSRIYSKGGYYYKSTDLYFLVNSNDEGFELIETAIRFLSDRGLGPKYSSGFGQFEYSGAKDVEINEGGDRFLTLSKYLPKNKGEIAALNGNSFYKVNEMKGLTRSGMHIPPVFLFAEGSCLGFKNDTTPKGKLHEVEGVEYALNGIMYPIKVK